MQTPAAAQILDTTSLSRGAQTLYVILAHAHPCPSGREADLQELLDFGLVVQHPHKPEGWFIARDPVEVLQERRERAYGQIEEAIKGVAALPDLLRPMAMAYQRAEPNLVTGAVEYVSGLETVNARLSDIIAGASQELLTSQPNGPRPAETLALSLPRDLAALRRGVAMRTIYRSDCRADAATASWAARVTQAGGNVRTLGADFLRAIIIDRRVAVIADHTPEVPGKDPIRALILHDPGVVAYASEMFDRDWDRASVWRGTHLPQQAVLTVRQQQIMQLLVTGAPQATVAKRLGEKERVVYSEIAAIKKISGTDGLVQMGYWYARYEAQMGAV